MMRIKRIFCFLQLELSNSGITSYTSDADLCSKLLLDDPCVCIDDSHCVLMWNASPYNNNSSNGFQFNCHCNNFARLRNNLIVNIPSNTMRITYSGHKLCYYSSSGGHSQGTVAGLSSYTYPIICLTESQNDESARSTLVLAHEISHTFGVYHHSGGSTDLCIMNTSNKNRYEMIDPEIYFQYWCADCIETIRTNANKY